MTAPRNNPSWPVTVNFHATGISAIASQKPELAATAMPKSTAMLSIGTASLPSALIPPLIKSAHIDVILPLSAGGIIPMATINGTAGNDWLEGTVDNDKLYGFKGMDVLLGKSGHDTLFGGDDADTLWGEDGNDTLYGDKGDDIIKGHIGNDILYGGEGDDWLFSGTNFFTDTAGDNALNGDEGNDYLQGGSGLDLLNGGTGNDEMRGEEGNDTYVITSSDGQDSIFDTYGTDVVKFSDVSSTQITAVSRTGDDSNDLLLGYGDGQQLKISNYFFTSSYYKRLCCINPMTVE